MKNVRILTAAIASIMLLATAFASAGTRTVSELKTSVNSIEQKSQIEDELLKMDGVFDAYLNTSGKVLTVKYDDDKVTTDMLTFKIVNELGFDAELIEKKDKDKKDSGNENNVEIDEQTENRLRSELHSMYESIKEFNLNKLFSTGL